MTAAVQQAGGIDIEANWDQVKTAHLPCGQPLNRDALVPLVSELPLEQRPGMERFISGVFQVQPAQPRSGSFRPHRQRSVLCRLRTPCGVDVCVSGSCRASAGQVLVDLRSPGRQVDVGACRFHHSSAHGWACRSESLLQLHRLETSDPGSRTFVYGDVFLVSIAGPCTAPQSCKVLDAVQVYPYITLYSRCTGHAGAVQVFEDLDFTLLEMNPFTLDSQGAPFPLDMRGELDDTAAFKSGVHLCDVTQHPLSQPPSSEQPQLSGPPMPGVRG